MNIYIIYKLTFSNGKVYIGQTKQEFNVRINQYYRDSFNKNRKAYYILISKAIRKYGWNNIKKEILFTASEEFVDELETQMIAEYKSANRKFGYNIELGGNKNKIISNETKKKISVSNTGKKHSEETRQKISKSKLGKYKGENSYNLGRKREDVSKRNIINKSKSIKMLDTDGNFIRKYLSIRQASRNLNLCAGHICKVLKNKQKTTGGYIFKYDT